MRSAPFTKEIYLSNPRNVPEWGNWTEFEIEHRGDIIKNFYLRVDLPSWLPSEIVNIPAIITDISGISYNWCNSIGFQMINRVQIMQDQVILHEIYGEYLSWYYRQQYTSAAYSIISENVNGNPFLRIPLPIIGSQRIGEPGLPMCALRGQRLRIRILFRPVNELIIASDGHLNPQPWGIPLSVQLTKSGPITTYTSLPKPRTFSAQLEQTVIYVKSDIQTWLKSQIIRIPFTNIQHFEYTISDNQLTASSLNRTVVHQIPLKLDFIGPVSRMLLGIRSTAATDAGDREKLTASNGAPFIRSIRLNIANIDRIQQMNTVLFKAFTDYWKFAGSNDLEVYTITFGGAMHSNMPCGTLSLTRASQPNLHIILNNIPYDPRNISRAAKAILYVETWNIYEIGNDVGKLMFDES